MPQTVEDFESLLIPRVGRSALRLWAIGIPPEAANVNPVTEYWGVAYDPLPAGWTTDWFPTYEPLFTSRPALDSSDLSGGTYFPSTPSHPTRSSVAVGNRLYFFRADIDLPSQPTPPGWDLDPVARGRGGTWGFVDIYYLFRAL
jgi:hypothetical protein